jgi:hypothetical protein
MAPAAFIATAALTEEEGLRCGVAGSSAPSSLFARDAGKYDHPWQAHLRITFNSRTCGYHQNQTCHEFCGGSLVSKNLIVTAAHCFKKIPGQSLGGVEMVEVTLGEYNTDLETGEELKMNVTGARVRVHPLFEPLINRVIVNGTKVMPTHAHDIATLHLAVSVNFTEHTNIVPICLPGEGANFTNVIGTSSGRGLANRTSGSGTGIRTNILQEFHPKIIGRDDCIQKLQAKRILPHESMICAEVVTAQVYKGGIVHIVSLQWLLFCQYFGQPWS